MLEYVSLVIFNIEDTFCWHYLLHMMHVAKINTNLYLGKSFLEFINIVKESKCLYTKIILAQFFLLQWIEISQVKYVIMKYFYFF